MHDSLTSARRRSAFLVLCFFLLVLAASWVFAQLIFGGVVALIAAAVFAAVSSVVAWRSSDRVALSMSHAVPADPAQFARLHNLIDGLCIAGGLKKPRLFIIDDPAPNAFATGRNQDHAAIAVTTGLLAKMNRIELEGVLAHELAHIKNNDILVATVAVTLVGLFALLSDVAMRFLWWGGPRHRDDQSGGNGGPAAMLVAAIGFAFLLLTPLIGKLMQFAISRGRESLADVTAVSLTRYPPGLIAALRKLQADSTVVHSASKATAHLWIESPLTDDPAQLSAQQGKTSRFNRLFMTHPPIEDRIAALLEL